LTRERDFWSRRREAVEAEAQAAEASQRAISESEERAALESQTDEEILVKLDLPDPDEMSAGDDFTKFMAKAVPERLRRRALRKLWLSNPVLANVDGLLDYGEDFTDSAMAVANIQTAYQVGKGMLKHVIEMERQAEEKEVDETPDDGEEPDEIVVAEIETTPSEADAEPADEVFTDAEEILPAPRRMQFTYSEDDA